jgi:hypothetical protein
VAALAVACSNDTTGPTNVPTALRSPVFAANAGTCTLANGNVVSTGFDALGYNRCAGLFKGPADGTDGVMDGKVWGDPFYALDHLVMKWNNAWDVCNFNRTRANCAGAWTDNEWNGKVQGGSGETWHYKISWVGSCGAYGTTLPDGGYCIWDEYEVILSQGTVANQHLWDVLAKPAGYGAH